MNIDLIFKIVVFVVVIGICIKAVKLITSLAFKIALVLLVILLLYKLFI